MDVVDALRDRAKVARILARQAPGEAVFDGGSAALAGRLADRGWSGAWLDHFRHGEFEWIRPTDGVGSRQIFGPYLPDLPHDAVISDWGFGRLAVASTEGEHAGHRYWHPLATVETRSALDDYPFPPVGGGRSVAELTGLVDQAREQGFTVIGQMSQTILETAYLLCGMDRLMLDFHLRPEFLEALFDKLSERRSEQARRLALAGVDVLRIGDDIATQSGLMIHPQMYRNQLQPHHARVIAAVREVNPELPVLYHSDGNLSALLDDLIAIGVTAINPVQPECMDPLVVSRGYGDRLTLWGCTPVQSVFATGSADEVRACTRWLLEQVAAPHGLIVQFINLIVTDQALDNLAVFCETFREWHDARPGA